VRAFFEQPFDVRQVFLDAATGATLDEWSDLQRQVAALGTGVFGDQKKLSVSPGSGGFTTTDRLRPPLISSYDFRYDVNRFIRFLNAFNPVANLTAGDLAFDSDNVWTDGRHRRRARLRGLHLRLLLHAPRAPRPRQRRHPDPLDHPRAPARGPRRSSRPTPWTPSSPTPSTTATGSCTTATGLPPSVVYFGST
jgi:hypothetical protein